MFFFGKPKPLNVHFFTAREEVFLHAKPKKAAAFIPKWFKDLPKGNYPDDESAQLVKIRTLRTCPGFIELYKSGFIFPLWSDLAVEVVGDNWRCQFSDQKSTAEGHNAIQLGLAPFLKDYVHLKLQNPWAMQADKKVNMVFTAPFWNNFGFDNAVVAPGAYSPHFTPADANINLFFKKQTQKVIYEIPFLHPIAHIVPMTERKLNIHYELITENELIRLKNKSPIFLMGSDRYKRAEKLCPHAK